MERWLGRFSDVAYALLRVMAGLMFALHGSQKFFDFPPGGHGTVELLSLHGLAGAIELVGGLMIALGIFAGYAAFIASGEMAVAYFMVHAPQSFWPVANGGELPALYSFVFLYIATRGNGRYAIMSRK
ncbi:MAG TPA: DoxX family protein [Thermoanaerobaculia bacterium]|nr:DoxX family protein [Thermoanaerobaculia bacterium]